MLKRISKLTVVSRLKQSPEEGFSKEPVLEHGEHGSWDCALEDAAGLCVRRTINLTTISLSIGEKRDKQKCHSKTAMALK